MASKRFHLDSRTRENFTERGLQSLTGQSTHEWRRYVVKELLDNALEAGDETDRDSPLEIDITLTYSDRAESNAEQRGTETAIRIQDNGPGISHDRLALLPNIVKQQNLSANWWVGQCKM